MKSIVNWSVGAVQNNNLINKRISMKHEATEELECFPSILFQELLRI